MKTVLITGGAGFIGSNLADYFVRTGDKVVVIDNLITGDQENIKKFLDKIIFIKSDLITENLEKALNKKQFDIVYHLASPASPVQYYRYPLETLLVNSQGTYNLLNYISNYSPQSAFVYASTSEIYGDPLEHPQTESYWGNVNPVGLRSCYDEGKRYGEALCMTYFRKHKLDIRIARLFNTYGPNMEKYDGRVISNFIVQALQNKPITVYGDGTQTRSFCYVSDMVDAFILLGHTKSLAGEIINLGNDDERPINDLAELVKKISHSSSEIITKSLPDDDPKRRKPDLSKAQKKLNWKTKIALDDGLLKTTSYFKSRFNL